MNANIFTDSFRVAWIDMVFVKHNLRSVLISSLVAPLLYVFAFGYGLGRDLTMDGLDYLAFMIPGVIAMTTLTACFNGVANKVMMQRVYYQSFDELYLCAISPTSIILGKAYAAMMRGLISCAILYAMGLILCPEIQLTVSAVAFILFSCLMYGLLGVVSGMLANSYLQLNAFNSLAILPMTFLCGTIFSLDNMGDPIQIAIGLLPLTHTTECMRATIIDTPFPWISFAILSAWTIVFFIASRHIMMKGRN